MLFSKYFEQILELYFLNISEIFVNREIFESRLRATLCSPLCWCFDSMVWIAIFIKSSILRHRWIFVWQGVQPLELIAWFKSKFHLKYNTIWSPTYGLTARTKFEIMSWWLLRTTKKYLIRVAKLEVWSHIKSSKTKIFNN